MTRIEQVIDMIENLTSEELDMWIKYGWVKPQQTGKHVHFNGMDIARIRLIAECRYQLDIELDSLEVILSLLDQVYGLRLELQTLVNAINTQSIDVRNDILNKCNTQQN